MQLPDGQNERHHLDPDHQISRNRPAKRFLRGNPEVKPIRPITSQCLAIIDIPHLQSGSLKTLPVLLHPPTQTGPSTPPNPSPTVPSAMAPNTTSTWASAPWHGTSGSSSTTTSRTSTPPKPAASKSVDLAAAVPRPSPRTLRSSSSKSSAVTCHSGIRASTKPAPVA